ncbi:radical SAM protein [Desulfotomaculum copahuensis]
MDVHMLVNTGQSLSSLLRQAQEVRRRNFPAAVQFDRPLATRAVSVTGRHCALNCAHCGGHFLRGMLSPAELENALAGRAAGTQNAAGGHGPEPPAGGPAAAGWRSLLVSGGCDRQGRVPVTEHPALLAEWKQNFRMNFHPGLVDEETARVIGQYADAVSFDFIIDDETIREVLGLDKTGADYIRSYRALRRHARVYPHLVIGLRGGGLAGEYDALEALRELGVDGLVLIVFFPVAGTRYAGRRPPDIEEAAAFIATARIMFPQMPLYLGCMRPRGRYRAQLDVLALQAGVNKIVLPARPAVEYARESGWRVDYGEECCVLS